jgi:hypothetical protein
MSNQWGRFLFWLSQKTFMLFWKKYKKIFKLHIFLEGHKYTTKCLNYFWHYQVISKNILRFSQILKAFSEYMNFKKQIFKAETILKGRLNSIPSPLKFKLWAAKFAWGVEVKHCWVVSTNFWEQKVCWQWPAMFCLYTSSKVSLPCFEFSPKVKVMGLNASYTLLF